MSEVAEATEALKLAFGKIEELTRQYGPQAVDTAAEVTRVNAIGHFMWAGGFATLTFACAALLALSIWRLRKGDGYDDGPWEFGCVAGGLGGLISFAVAVAGLFDVWAWVALSNPKLALAHDVLAKIGVAQ